MTCCNIVFVNLTQSYNIAFDSRQFTHGIRHTYINMYFLKDVHLNKERKSFLRVYRNVLPFILNET